MPQSNDPKNPNQDPKRQQEQGQPQRPGQPGQHGNDRDPKQFPPGAGVDRDRQQGQQKR